MKARSRWRPEVTGRVTEILVEEGDQVKREQLLMRLDPRAPRAAIEQSQAQVRQARLSIERRQVDFDTQVAKVKRFEALRAQGMVDVNSLAELVSARNLAEVDLRTSREQLSQALAQLRQAQEHARQDRDPLTARWQGDGYLRQGGPDRGAELLRHRRLDAGRRGRHDQHRCGDQRR